MIAIIGIMASAFLLVSYYAVVSKYCGNMESLRRRLQRDQEEENNGTHTPRNELWQAATTGLDEVLIKSIAVCKYKKGDGLVEGTDCSVCLSEFQEDESLRLLPKCRHAFHLPCIDMWLKSHSNCPLCRSAVIPTSSSPPQLPAPAPDTPPEHRSTAEHQRDNDAVATDEEQQTGEAEPSLVSGTPKSPVQAHSHLDSSEERDTIVEIRDEQIQTIRRSFSLDYHSQDRVSIADILMMNMEADHQVNSKFPSGVGSSKNCGEQSKSNNRSNMLHCVISPTAMKRSASSGRYFFTRYSRGRNATLPI